MLRRARLDPEPPLGDPVQLVSPRTAYWITDILADDEARAFIFGRGSQLEFPFPVAVKTGTVQLPGTRDQNKDAWTVGYTPTIAAASNRCVVAEPKRLGAVKLSQAKLIGDLELLKGLSRAKKQEPRERGKKACRRG